MFNQLFRYKKDCGSSKTRSHVENPLDIKLRDQMQNAGPVSKSSFSHVAPLFWNSLPNELRCCKTKDKFRRKVKQHLLEPYSTIINCQNRLCSDTENCIYSRNA